MKYLTIVFTIIFTTYGQIVIKYGINQLGEIPNSGIGKVIKYFMAALMNVWILSGLFAAVLAAFCWMAAMSKFELSSVYPYQSLNFILVPLFSVLLFGESMNVYKVAGIVVIIFGIIIFSKGF